MIKAILIDDIEQARKTLRRDLETYAPDVQIIGEASGVIEGAKLLKQEKPDLLFLDIQMQDGSGFDLLDILPNIDFKIIFITASDAHAIKAFRYTALNYLLKPIDPDELVEALKQFRKNHVNEQEKYDLLAKTMKTSEKLNEKLALHAQDKIHIVTIDEIIRCESTVNYTEFHFSDGKRIVVSKTLKDFEEILSPHGFYRVHQSHLVNARMIREFVKTEGGHLIMNNGKMVPVSSRKRAEVIRMLEEL